MAKEDTKVFDVAKPGEAKPQTGAKPMVVGHKLMKDPSVSDAESSKEITEEQQPIAQTSKKTIVPISEQEKNSDETNDTEKEQNTVDDKPEEVKEEKTESENKDITESVDQDESDSSKEKEKTPSSAIEKNAEEAISNEENLQRIVNEKTYYVSIKEASYSSAKSFIKTFLFVGILAAVTVALLIDAEILDLGIELPFDFL